MCCAAPTWTPRGWVAEWVCGTGSELLAHPPRPAPAPDALRACCLVPSPQVVLFGRSLGGAVAAYAAGRYRRHLSGLIIENTFSSVVDVVPHVLPLLSALVGPGK